MVFGNYIVRYSVHADVMLALRLRHPKEDRGYRI